MFPRSGKIFVMAFVFDIYVTWPHVTIFFLIAVIITNENYWTFQPLGIYLLKVNNRNTRTRCEISWKLTVKTPEILKRTVILVSLLLTLNRFHIYCSSDLNRWMPAEQNWQKWQLTGNLHTTPMLKVNNKDTRMTSSQLAPVSLL